MLYPAELRGHGRSLRGGGLGGPAAASGRVHQQELGDPLYAAPQVVGAWPLVALGHVAVGQRVVQEDLSLGDSDAGFEARGRERVAEAVGAG